MKECTSRLTVPPVLVTLWFLRTVTLIQAESLETARLFPLNSLGLLPTIVPSSASDTDGLPWKLLGFKRDLTLSIPSLRVGVCFMISAFTLAEH